MENVKQTVKLRKRVYYTQQQLAKAVDCSVETIKKYEKKDKYPYLITYFLNKEYEELLNATPPKQALNDLISLVHFFKSKNLVVDVEKGYYRDVTTKSLKIDLYLFNPKTKDRTTIIYTYDFVEKKHITFDNYKNLFSQDLDAGTVWEQCEKIITDNGCVLQKNQNCIELWQQNKKGNTKSSKIIYTV